MGHWTISHLSNKQLKKKPKDHLCVLGKLISCTTFDDIEWKDK
jgi:hypothetical protein